MDASIIEELFHPSADVNIEDFQELRLFKQVLNQLVMLKNVSLFTFFAVGYNNSNSVVYFMILISTFYHWISSI